MAQTSAVGATGWGAAALAGVIAGLVAAHALGPLERDVFSSHRHPALTSSWSMIFFRKPVSAFRDHALAPRASVQVIDRSHKGNRLDARFSPGLDAQASGRMALRQLLERARSLELREACEPPASPIVDPQLAKLPGRCLT